MIQNHTGLRINFFDILNLGEKMTEEIWKDVVGYEGLYSVSSFGCVKSHTCWAGQKDNFILKARVCRRYFRVTLYKNKISKSCFVHKLVAEAFIGDRPNGKQINHKDCDKLNNNVTNLEYVTPSENCLHAFRM